MKHFNISDFHASMPSTVLVLFLFYCPFIGPLLVFLLLSPSPHRVELIYEVGLNYAGLPYIGNLSKIGYNTHPYSQIVQKKFKEKSNCISTYSPLPQNYFGLTKTLIVFTSVPSPFPWLLSRPKKAESSIEIGRMTTCSSLSRTFPILALKSHWNRWPH